MSFSCSISLKTAHCCFDDGVEVAIHQEIGVAVRFLARIRVARNVEPMGGRSVIGVDFFTPVAARDNVANHTGDSKRHADGPYKVSVRFML